MKSVEALFPWLVFVLALISFAFGFWGLVGGLVLIIGTILYLHKSKRTRELKLIIGTILVVFILVMVVNTAVTFE